jgi:hypothetical protein
MVTQPADPTSLRLNQASPSARKSPEQPAEPHTLTTQAATHAHFKSAAVNQQFPVPSRKPRRVWRSSSEEANNPMHSSELAGCNSQVAQPGVRIKWLHRANHGASKETFQRPLSEGGARPELPAGCRSLYSAQKPALDHSRLTPQVLVRMSPALTGIRMLEVSIMLKGQNSTTETGPSVLESSAMHACPRSHAAGIHPALEWTKQ